MASSTEEVTLFDIPSKGHCACWSLNPWKTRLVLNLKNIPFKTHWIEYPDIAPTFKSYNIPPNPQGTPYSPFPPSPSHIPLKKPHHQSLTPLQQAPPSASQTAAT